MVFKYNAGALLYFLLLLKKFHEETKTKIVLIPLTILTDFPILSVALSPKPNGNHLFVDSWLLVCGANCGAF